MILPAVLLKRNYLIWTLDLRRNCAVATQSPNPVSSMCCACCFDATSYIPTQAWKRKDRQMFVCISVDPKSNVKSQRPTKNKENYDKESVLTADHWHKLSHQRSSCIKRSNSWSLSPLGNSDHQSSRAKATQLYQQRLCNISLIDTQMFLSWHHSGQRTLFLHISCWCICLHRNTTVVTICNQSSIKPWDQKTYI